MYIKVVLDLFFREHLLKSFHKKVFMHKGNFLSFYLVKVICELQTKSFDEEGWIWFYKFKANSLRMNWSLMSLTFPWALSSILELLHYGLNCSRLPLAHIDGYFLIKSFAFRVSNAVSRVQRLMRNFNAQTKVIHDLLSFNRNSNCINLIKPNALFS